jgi:phenol 2-monooxygenase
VLKPLVLAAASSDRQLLPSLPVDQNERHAVAHDLITFDHKFSRLFSGKPKSAEEEGISVQEFEQVFEKSMLWASGTVRGATLADLQGTAVLTTFGESQGVTYKPSMITLDTSKCKVDLAKNLTLGTVSRRRWQDRWPPSPG